MTHPLILVTNDDGIASAGLWALAEAMIPLGDVLVAAPTKQWSGCGRAMPFDVTGELVPVSRRVAGELVEAFAIDASPALAVVHGVIELAGRRPDLVVSGINAGLNLGSDVTISGTVGAALQAAAFGIPAIAVSLEMDPRYHLTGQADADYAPSMLVAQRFACYTLARSLPFDVDVLNINVPCDADETTPWRLTRASRRSTLMPVAPDRRNAQGRPHFRQAMDHTRAEMDSDTWALHVDRVMTVSPLSLDLSARADLNLFKQQLRSELATGAEVAQLSPYMISNLAPVTEPL